MPRSSVFIPLGTGLPGRPAMSGNLAGPQHSRIKLGKMLTGIGEAENISRGTIVFEQFRVANFVAPDLWPGRRENRA